jgi:c-di-GMP-binding flagellar brake protein YcgR
MENQTNTMQPRKDRRFKQWNKAVIRSLDGEAAFSEHEAFTYDLSLGGARIHSVQPYEVGTPVRLRIALVRTQEIISIEGHVKWLKQSEAENVYEMGVQFRHANSQTLMSLMKNLHEGRPTSAR